MGAVATIKTATTNSLYKNVALMFFYKRIVIATIPQLHYNITERDYDDDSYNVYCSLHSKFR
jgi:hypothetical protein